MSEQNPTAEDSVAARFAKASVRGLGPRTLTDEQVDYMHALLEWDGHGERPERPASIQGRIDGTRS
jgi:hypothetical protein